VRDKGQVSRPLHWLDAYLAYAALQFCAAGDLVACWHSAGKFAFVTSSSHNMTMQHVGIAELKSRLSEYLDVVRRGTTLAVMNRDVLIAHVVPVRERAALHIRKPAPGTPPPNRVRLPKALALNLDVVDLLLEERQGQR
jgi:antitoxin (DNA-binding transcriptional repressor) of toxin-antitoxin stability system